MLVFLSMHCDPIAFPKEGSVFYFDERKKHFLIWFAMLISFPCLEAFVGW